jgi:hypothetical protein
MKINEGNGKKLTNPFFECQKEMPPRIEVVPVGSWKRAITPHSQARQNVNNINFTRRVCNNNSVTTNDTSKPVAVPSTPLSNLVIGLLFLATD